MIHLSRCIRTSNLDPRTIMEDQRVYDASYPDRANDEHEIYCQTEFHNAWRYARQYGLCKNYFDEHHDAFQGLQTYALPIIPSDWDFDAHAGSVINEKLAISKPEVALLRAVILDDYAEDDLRLPNLKLELPLLHTDNELDLRSCLSPKDFKVHDLRRMAIPWAGTDQDGSNWSPDFIDRIAEQEAELFKDKLQVPRETLTYLKTLQDDWMDEVSASE